MVNTSTTLTSMFGGLFDGATQGQINDVIFSGIIDEMFDNLIAEAVEHFTKYKQPSSLADDARYLYNSKEMRIFFKKYLEQGGDLKILRVNNVYHDNGEWLCYEICRRKIYIRIKDTPQDVYYGSKKCDITPFLPKVIS